MNCDHLKTAKTYVKEIDIRAHIKHWIINENMSFRNLSHRIGMGENFLYDKMKKGDLTGAEMIALSNALQVNIPEVYMLKINETCRPTRWEKALKIEIADLKKENEALKKELDWFKETVRGRV